MWISPAYAQAGEVAPPNALLQLAPMFFIVIIFYFLIIRPQMTARKNHQEMVSNIKRGDRVVTAGGLIGKVSKVLDDEEVMIELADNMSVRAVKSTISHVGEKTAPAAKPANDK